MKNINKQNLPLNLREKMNSRIGFISSIVVLVLLVIIFNRLDYNLIRKPSEQAQQDAAEQQQEEEKETELAAQASDVTTATVIAVGDNLYHQSVIDSGSSDSETWNYDAIYANVKDEIQAADIAMVDQETVFTTDHSSVSGYPSFATPTEVGDALINAGFDVIESATNHIDDFGYDYLAQTLNFWKTSYPTIPVLGIHETQEDADSVKTMTVNGITVAFLDYTYGTNNSGAGDGYEYMIDIFDKDKVATMVEKAKAVSDCVIFVAHWGKEQESMPTEYEKEWATYLMQLGVDVVIGGHPHILQPYGWMSDDDGHKMLIYYSLGNFVSNQESMSALLEGMASFTIQKSTDQNGDATIEITDATVKPMVMHYNWDSGVFTPYMLEDYTEELAAQHSVRTSNGNEDFTLANLQAMFEQIMSMNVTPSSNTDLLDVTINSDGTMTDADGNYVEDTWSVSSEEYLAQQNTTAAAEDTSADESADSEENSEDSGSTDEEN